MVSELGTSHMGVKGDFPGAQYGTGASYLQIEGKWFVSWVAPGSSAQLAGLKRGWVITGSDGDCTAQTKVVAQSFLDLQDQTRKLELACAIYSFPAHEPPGSLRAVEEGAVYLRLTSFSPGPAKELADQVALNKSANAYVLDLRGNFGGGTETLRKVFDLFFSAKTVIGKFRFQNGKEHTLRTGGSKSAYRGRIVVLVDRYTQSAAEVFAQAIQDTGRGVIVGQPTSGGVLLGNHFKLPHGFDLHLAVADYHSVKGVRLEGRGVIPDVVVELTPKDYRENRDAVLERVNQLLQLP
jgi:carboxyl-terminal processing protease